VAIRIQKHDLSGIRSEQELREEDPGDAPVGAVSNTTGSGSSIAQGCSCYHSTHGFWKEYNWSLRVAAKTALMI